MKKHILILLLLCSTGIANASRMFNVIEEEEITQNYQDLYDEQEELEEEIEDLKEEIKSLKREIASRPTVKYVEKPVVIRPVVRRRIISRPIYRPVCYTPVTRVVYHDSCGSSFAAGLFGMGIGAAIGAACSR